MAWQEGDLEDLTTLTNEISTAFFNLPSSGSEQDTWRVRSAIEELLIREKSPTYYRAQLLLYKAGTEHTGDHVRIRERLEDAKYWTTDLRHAMKDVEGGDDMSRVLELERRIDEKLAELNEVGPSGSEAFGEKMRTEELRDFDRASRLVD